MNPFLFITVTIGIGVLFEKLFQKEEELSEIKPENIFEDFKVKYFKKSHVGATKTQITKSIEKIIPEYKSFKIGKTGNPTTRNAGHKTYTSMFLLCDSKDSDFISELENYYNSKYISHSKNDNKKVGSAGKSVSINGHYYLYIVVR
ncbi:MAG: hypothetical protein CVT95_12480 [Bacteroidetes bacterium HGW-Bacteroidetes-12]|nr:MAG: hypothetical protein CVT95_12480 [Bacteroidetes bacterium HGW-Bacteroidetes-12]